MSPRAEFITTLTLLYVLMAVATSARSWNDCNTFEQMQRCDTRTGFSIGSSHRVLCVLCAPHVMYRYVIFFVALRFLHSLNCCFPRRYGPSLFIRVYCIEYRRLLRAQYVESSIRIALPRSCEWYCRLLPRGPRPGQDRILLSLCF